MARVKGDHTTYLPSLGRLCRNRSEGQVTSFGKMKDSSFCVVTIATQSPKGGDSPC